MCSSYVVDVLDGELRRLVECPLGGVDLVVGAVGQDHAHARDGVSRQAALLAEVQEALLHAGHERLRHVGAGRDVLRRWHFIVGKIIVSEVISDPQFGHLSAWYCTA